MLKMNTLTATLFIYVIVTIIHTSQSAVSSNKTVSTNWGYEIIDGNCDYAVMKDLVFHQHIHKGRVLLMSKEAKAEYHGDKKIYCIRAISTKSEPKGSKVRVSSGGIDHSFVSFEMKSGKSHGLEYDISVYAK